MLPIIQNAPAPFCIDLPDSLRHAPYHQLSIETVKKASKKPLDLFLETGIVSAGYSS